LNAGTLTVAGFATAITFSRVENLTGADTAKDTFVIDELAGVTGGIDHRDGDLEIQLFDYFFADGDISIDSHIGDLRLNDDTFFDDVDYQLFTAENLDAFLGVGGPGTQPDAFGL